MGIAFVNVSGRCNDEASMKIICESLDEIMPHWGICTIAEADFVQNSEFGDFSVDGYMTRRHYGGVGTRAIRIVAKACIAEDIQSISWSSRSVRISFKFNDQVQNLIFSHLAHGPAWVDSVDEVLQLAGETSWPCALWLGDFNVDYNRCHCPDVSEKWKILESASHSLRLTLNAPLCRDQIVTRRPWQGNAGEESWIDHVAVHTGFDQEAICYSWSHLIADHAWVLVPSFLPITTPSRKTAPKNWLCNDFMAFFTAAEDLHWQPSDTVNDWTTSISMLIEEHRKPIAQKFRRCSRESPIIKDLRRRVRVSYDPRKTETLWQQIFTQKCLERNAQKTLNDLSNFKKQKWWPKKAQKLFNIEGIVDAHAPRNVQTDMASCADAIAKKFAQRWTQTEQGDLELLASVFPGESHGINISTTELLDIIDMVRKRNHLDSMGICALAIIISPRLLEICCFYVNKLLSCNDAWNGLHAHGSVKGKRSAVSHVTETRALMPQTLLAEICHRILVIKLAPHLVAYAEDNGINEKMLGYSKGSQIFDITFTVQRLIEKSLDNRNAGGVCVSDIRNFFDEAPIGALLPLLIKRGVPHNWAEAAVRLHVVPKVVLKVGNVRTPPIKRTRGLTTGSHSAMLLARTYVEDSYISVRKNIEPLSWRTNIINFDACSWVDNLTTFGSNAQQACEAMSCWAEQLRIKFNLNLKLSSMESLQAGVGPSLSSHISQDHEDENSSITIDNHVWKLVDRLDLLGSIITANNDSSALMARFVAKAWKAFWANAYILKCRSLPLKNRVEILNNRLKGLLLFYLPSLPLSKTNVRKVTSLQHQIVQKMTCLDKRWNESDASYFVRRTKHVDTTIKEVGTWKQTYFESVQAWREHMDRHPLSMPHVITNCMNTEWLRSRRASFPDALRNEDCGRLDIRSAPGRPKRWEQPFFNHVPTSNPSKDKDLTKSRTNMYHFYI